MKVLLVNGGPHRQGCTFTALSEVAGALEKQGIDTETLWLGVEPVAGCIGCGRCFATGRCFIGDAVNEVIARSAEFDGFVFGTPVHFASATGSLTGFMDRLFYGRTTLFAYKPAAAVASCRRAGSTAALDQLNKYFAISRMPVVSSQYWNMVHGTTPEEVRRDAEGMQIMRTLGVSMAWLPRCIEAGRAVGIGLPEAEEPVRTNFIR